METNYSINLPISPQDQVMLVNTCNQFKTQLYSHAQYKKDIMRVCYSYSKGEFAEGDLFPSPAMSLGAENDAKTYRPNIFIPLSRTQLKMLYSQLKLSIFPNEDDFFRVIAKSEEGGEYEDALTKGMAWLIKQSNITEKISKALLSAIWSGMPVGYPCIRPKTYTEWAMNALEGNFEATTVEDGYEFDFEAWNPLDFYPDPYAQDAESARWFYSCRKKSQDFFDKPNQYLNLDLLKISANDRASQSQDMLKNNDVSYTNSLQPDFIDIQPYCDYDLYYFPFISVGGQEYRNMMVGVANENILLRFSPNMMPKGYNPAVFSTWMPETGSLYGVGPLEDIRDIQKIINIVWNYAIESAARNGNRWAVRDDVDTASLFGAAGGLVTTADDPRTSIMPLSGDMSELGTLINSVGVLKAEAQSVAGSQHPFQGSSNIDFKKTATELQIIQENAMSILREVIEHISLTFVQPIMERYLWLAASEIKEPLVIRVDDRSEGTKYMTIDFGLVKQFPFTVEITSVNLSQSKMAIVNTLQQFLSTAQANPEVWGQLKDNGYHLLKLMGEMMGIKYIDRILNTPQEQTVNKVEDLQEEFQMAQLQQQMQAALMAQQPMMPGMPPGMSPEMMQGQGMPPGM